jgi:hypothetical protein
MVMALQMLPLREIGKMLSTNQWTEELPHNAADDAGKHDASLLQKALLPVYSLARTSLLTEAKANAYIHQSERIPSNHSTDVVSPPPDVV